VSVATPGLALLLLIQAPAPAPAPVAPRPAAPPGLSWEDADELARTLTRVERRLRSGRPASTETLAVTQRQINSYLNLLLAPKIPPGVSGLEVRLEQDRLGARGLVDLDQVRSRLPRGGASGLLALLSGTVPVELAGRMPNGYGVGRIELEQASVGGVSLPVSVVAELVSLATRSATNPKGFDLLAPFPLPWSARRVRFEPGRAVVDFDR
jgi:hypothetical protein